MNKKFLYLFRVPEGIVTFFSGVLISTAINMLTSQDLIAYWHYLAAAICMVCGAFALVVISIVVHPIENEFQEERSANKGRLKDLWADKLTKYKNSTKVLLGCSIIVAVTVIATILFLIIPPLV